MTIPKIRSYSLAHLQGLPWWGKWVAFNLNAAYDRGFVLNLFEFNQFYISVIFFGLVKISLSTDKEKKKKRFLFPCSNHRTIMIGKDHPKI
mgnify:CR=1 FL=1